LNSFNFTVCLCRNTQCKIERRVVTRKIPYPPFAYYHLRWLAFRCVWELFTLFAFSQEGDAREKIEFEPVRGLAGEEALAGSEPVAEYIPSDVPESLKQFNLARAHCFDPNEENRLRGVIEARGVDVFEGRIRDLALQCEFAITESRASEPRSQRSWTNLKHGVTLSYRLGNARTAASDTKPKRASMSTVRVLSRWSADMRRGRSLDL